MQAEHELPPPLDEQTPAGDPEAVARVVCLRLLDKRARSRAELEQALRRRGVPDDAAARVLDRFSEVGLVDDATLAHSMASAQHRERGLARRAVAGKLRSRGFDDDVVADALTEIDGSDERQRAYELAERRVRALSRLPGEVQLRRLAGYLGRKGYPAGLAFEVARAVVGENGVSDESDIVNSDSW
ncbi:MAG TPA: regulatory protein RecX [Jatrophihabitans sp.]|nr:regulatory protein RecX [Jatrophihabitans sp.]